MRRLIQEDIKQLLAVEEEATVILEKLWSSKSHGSGTRFLVFLSRLTISMTWTDRTLLLKPRKIIAFG